MKLTLVRFGSEEVEIDPNTLIEFPCGLPGFEDCKRFKLFHTENTPCLFWLQSVDDTEVVFSLADPDVLKVYYDLSLTPEELATLRVEPDDELRIAVILSQQSKDSISAQSAILANLKSPLIINVTKRTALQKPLFQAELTIRA